MKQFIHRIYVVCLLAMLFIQVAAQRFVNVSFEGAQTVCAITQDAQGMMWVGTDNGLYSYDGYHGYLHYQDHAYSNTRVNALAFDNNLLYLATGNGVLKFDTHANAYVQTPAVADFQDEAKRKAVRELRVLDLKDKNANYGGDVYALLHTSKGLLQGKINGLYLNNRLLPLTAGAQPLVNALAYDAKRHCYWIGTEGALYCADLNLQTFSRIAALDGNSVKCLAEEANGNLYIGTDNGLYVMAMNNAISHYSHDSRNEATIPNNIVWACFVDKWQNVWIGTDNGLSRLTTHTYYNYVSLDKITMSGEGNCLHAMLQTRNGEWWMGGTNGLIHYSQAKSSTGDAAYQDVAWYKQNNQAYPLSHNRVRKIYEDHDGDVWICTDHGINLYDRSSRQMRNFIVYDRTGKYSTAWAYDILQDKKGRIWMGSYQGGVFVMDKAALLSGKTIADWHFSDKGKNALSGLHVGQMVMDGKGRIWVSTYIRLDCINPNDMKVVQVANSDVVNYLMADSKGNIWMGDNNSVTCYYVAGTVLGNSFSSKTWQIGGKVSTMCDVEGKIWVVSGNECCVINPEGESQRFMIPSVVPLNICYSRQTHEVMMGGNDGYVAISSDVAQKPKQFTRLMLAGIIVNGQACEERGEILKLKSDENNFTLQLTDLPFADHPSAVYAYKLEGSDHDWHYLNSGNIDITYNGLSYGDYHLTVHAVDGEGKIAAEVYSLDISVLPPWYLSFWCKLFYITALIVFVAWLVSWYFLRKELADAQKQKAEVLEQVQMRIDFFNRLTEDLKAAVAHRSFDEVTALMVRYLNVKIPEVSSSVATGLSASPVSDPESSSSEPVPARSESSEEEKQEVDVSELDVSDKRLLEEINEAIEKYMIDSDFNVSMLQDVIGIGGKQLYRKMKAITGRTPVEYIREMRMSRAAELLSQGKFSVSEVMYTVGFSNSSYFSKCFSKEYGMTPTEYMKVKR